MLKQEDIHITALPIEGESRYILNQVDKVLRAKNPRLVHVDATLANLIDYIVAEFVAPNATDSLLSLYLGSKNQARDVAITNRLSELADLCAKLQELSKLSHVCVQNALVVRMVRVVQSILNRRKWTVLYTFKQGIQERPISPKKQIPKLPFIDQKSKACLPCAVKCNTPSSKAPCPPLLGKCPPLPGTTKSSKVSGPPVPLMGKVSGPPVPCTGKVTCPPLPILGKASGPPVPGLGKGCGPAIPLSVVGSPPPVPYPTKGTIAGKTIPATKSPGPIGEQALATRTVFYVPLIDDNIEKYLDTRKLHWQSIPANRFKNSVFESSKLCQVNLDLNLIKSHFVKANLKTGMFSPTNSPSSRAPTAANSPIATSASLTLPSVLETKRIQQIEIFLNGRKGLTCSDIVSTLKTGGSSQDDSVVVDLLEAVLAIYPSEEERTALSAQIVRFKEANMALAKADAFLIDLIAVPEIQIACNYVIILHTAETATSDLVKYFSQLNQFLDRITRSSGIVHLLSIVGSVVVYLWNGKKNHFNGFTVEMTSQLKKVSSFTDREYSMLHYVIEELNKDELMTQIMNELSPVETLLDWDFADAVQRADEVERSVRAVKPKDRLNNQYYPALISRLNGFKDRMENGLFVKLENERSNAIEKAKYTLQYFAESDKKSVTEFLVSMNTLRIDLAMAKSQLDKRMTVNRSSKK